MEVRNSMGGAFTMFLLADVRDMAQKKELKGDPALIRKLVEFPMDCYEFLTLYQENAAAIQERIKSKELYDLYASFLGVPADADSEQAEKYLRAVQFFHFEDAKADEECVYGIGVNHLKQRITVAFRGR